jgi:hypothetical protein
MSLKQKNKKQVLQWKSQQKKKKLLLRITYIQKNFASVIPEETLHNTFPFEELAVLTISSPSFHNNHNILRTTVNWHCQGDGPIGNKKHL